MTDQEMTAFEITVERLGGDLSDDSRAGRFVGDVGCLEVAFRSDGPGFVFEVEINRLLDACVYGVVTYTNEVDAFLDRCASILGRFEDDYREELTEAMAGEAR